MLFRSDRFVAKYGAINSKGNILAFSDDDQFPLLRSIEDERKDKTGWDKSAIFTKATIRPFRQVNHADTAEDALQICLNHKLHIDPVELRLKNIVREGMFMPAYFGETANACALDRCIMHCADNFHWAEKYPVRDMGNGKVRAAGKIGRAHV